MNFQLDHNRTKLEFAVKHMLISTVRGRFSDFEAELQLDPERLQQGSVRARVAARSIETGDRMRDDYLRGEFLSPERFPHLTFQSTQVALRGTKLTLSGRLKIKDIERPVELSGSVRGPYTESGVRRLSFELKGELDREAFGLNFNQTVETVSIVVGKKVHLLLQIELVEQAEG